MYTRLRSQKYGSSDTTSESRRATPALKMTSHDMVRSSAVQTRTVLINSNARSSWRTCGISLEDLLLEEITHREKGRS